MPRIAEIPVQAAVSASKSGRADNRDQAQDSLGFSALVDSEAGVAAETAGEAAVLVGKVAQVTEPKDAEAKGAKALQSLDQLIGLLPGAPVNAPAETFATGVTQAGATAMPDDIVAQARTALAAAAESGLAADDHSDTPVADADPDAAVSSANPAQAASVSAAVIATAIAAPVVVAASTIVAADSDPQAVPASPGKVVPTLETGAPVTTDADAALVAADAAPAETVASGTAPLAAPPEVAVAVPETHETKRPVAVTRHEAAAAPAQKPTSVDVPVSAVAGDAKANTAEIHTAAAAPGQIHHKQTQAAGEGSQTDGAKKDAPKESGRADAASVALSDAKPVVAAPAPLQTQPAQAPDALVNAPAAVAAPSATQPALLQAQLMATPAAADTPVPVDGLAVEIAVRAGSGKNRFEIRLDPPELGRIDVRLDIDRHGRVGTHLVVEKAETLDLLRRDAPQLERALSDSGLKTGDGSLQFSLRDQSFAGRNDHNDGRQSARLIVAEEDTVPAAIAGRSYRTPGAAGGLDIRV